MKGFIAPVHFAFWAAFLVGIDADSTCEQGYPLDGKTFKLFVDDVGYYVSWGGSSHYIYADYSKASAVSIQFFADHKKCNTYELQMEWKGTRQWLGCTNSGLWLKAYDSRASAAPFLFEHIRGDQYTIKNSYASQLVGRNGKNWLSYTGSYNEIRATYGSGSLFSLQEEPKKFTCKQSYPLDGKSFNLLVNDANKYVNTRFPYYYMYADSSKNGADSFQFHADYEQCNSYKLKVNWQSSHLWLACTNTLWLKRYDSPESAAPFLFEHIGGDQYKIKNSYATQLVGRNGKDWLTITGKENEISADSGEGSIFSLQEDPNAPWLSLGQLKLTPSTGAILAVVVVSFSVVALVMRRRFASQSAMKQGLIESEA